MREVLTFQYDLQDVDVIDLPRQLYIHDVCLRSWIYALLIAHQYRCVLTVYTMTDHTSVGGLLDKSHIAANRKQCTYYDLCS
jgi:hypothetical protein